MNNDTGKVSMDQRLRVTIKGQVQGVGFRWFLMQQADSLKLSGWAKSLANGNIEAVAEGPKDALDKFHEKVRTGPPRADIAKVEEVWSEAKGGFVGFELVTR